MFLFFTYEYEDARLRQPGPELRHMKAMKAMQEGLSAVRAEVKKWGCLIMLN